MDDAYTGDNTTARKYMTGNARNGYTWKPRPQLKSENYFWPGTDAVTEADQKAYDDFRSSVDPNYKPPTSSRLNVGKVPGEEYTEDGTPGEVTKDMPAIPPPGTIRMRTPDGRIVNVPANKVAEAEARGGRRLR